MGIETEIRDGKIGDAMVAFRTRTLLSKTANGSGGKVFQVAFSVTSPVGKLNAITEPFDVFFVLLCTLFLRDETVNDDECAVSRNEIRPLGIPYGTEGVADHEADESFFKHFVRDFGEFRGFGLLRQRRQEVELFARGRGKGRGGNG